MLFFKALREMDNKLVNRNESSDTFQFKQQFNNVHKI